MHVTKGAKPPLDLGYVQTGRYPNMDNYTPTVYALDCEMVSVYICYVFTESYYIAIHIVIVVEFHGSDFLCTYTILCCLFLV